MEDPPLGIRCWFPGLLLVSFLVVVNVYGCTKPDAALRAEWNTPESECIDCHSKDPKFKTTKIEKHNEIHCLECHEVNPQHYANRKKAFDGVYENIAIREDRCLVCHPTDRYSNAGHWRHLGVRANLNARPMQCIDCHTDGHNLSLLNDCTECHAETSQNAQIMATGHCIICHGFVRTTLTSKTRDLHPYQAGVCDNCHQLEDDAKALDRDSFRSALLDPHIAKTSCSVCHNPHDLNDPGEDLTCKRCHSNDELDSVITHTIKEHLEFNCITCHEAHHFGLTAGSECVTCHSDEKSVVFTTGIEEHKNCNACHTDNTYSATYPESCNNCHIEEGQAIISAPVNHRECNICHTPHKWENPTISPCQKCHVNIRDESKLIAIKTQCTICHDSHNADKPEIPLNCSNCHPIEYKLNLNSPLKTDCSLCHSAHKWVGSWDSCVGCHADLETALHREHKDYSCESCHLDHTWKPDKNSICLVCHVDYENHKGPGLSCFDCHWLK